MEAAKKEKKENEQQKSVYQENGYENRSEYLKSLAQDYGVSYGDVCTIASMYGPSEDFDGLIVALEDHAELIGA